MDNQVNPNNGMMDNNVPENNVNTNPAPEVNTPNNNVNTNPAPEVNTPNNNVNINPASEVNTPNNNVNINPTPEVSATNNNGGKNTGLIIVIVVLALVILAGAVYFFIQKNNKEVEKEIVNDTPSVVNKEEPETPPVVEPTVGPDEEVVNVEVGKDWKSYSFAINNKTLTLPLSYESLSSATGFTIKSDFESSTIPKGYYTSVNLYKNDKLALYTEMYNNTETAIKYTDATISRVSQTKYQVETSKADKIVFPGNLTAGMSITKDQIINLFGEPTKIDNYSNNNYNSDTYTYNANPSWSTTNYYKIEVVNGVIDTLTLDNRN